MPTNFRYGAFRVISALFVCSFLTVARAADTILPPANLRCEYLIDPLGIGETAPRLSWMLQSSERGTRQEAYQVLVASSPMLLAKEQGDLWNSNKISSDESAHVTYAGKPLTSQMSCYWKVRVWSAGKAQPSEWSSSAFWTMGLLKPEDWKANWIDSTGAIAADNAKNPIAILSAVYQAVPARRRTGHATTQSTTQDSIDVTATLSGMVKNGALEVVVSNKNMGRDPAMDKHKQLVVEYRRAGKVETVTSAEDSTLSLPVASSRVWNLSKTFQARGAVKSATLYATALGVYEMKINGRLVGDQVLAPGWTDYTKRIRYQAYDVTPLLVGRGYNTIVSQVADGWYAGHLGNGGYHQYGTTPGLLAQMQITYGDGSTECVATDATWKTAPSEIQSTDFMLGETVDARLALDSVLSHPGLTTGWAAATLRDFKSPELDPQVAPAVRETGLIKPISLNEPAPGKWTFDMGQNMVGVVRLKLNSPAGTVITLHHAEMLNPKTGTIYTTNLRGAPSVDVYTCSGAKDETWQPKFTFHGFRYVEVTGLEEKPPMEMVTGVVLGSDTPRTGSFSCSDPRINQLMSNIQWGQRGNYLSVPTDCPQRDERLGWMGDAQVFVRTATCNADVASFFTKWLVDVDDAQKDGAFLDVSPDRGTGSGTPAWGDAGVICPWTIYLAYGDKRILEKHLPAMTKWVEWCKANSTDLIRDKRNSRGGDYGDWLSIKADTPKDLIGTAYFAYSTHLVALSYAAIGDKENADKYLQLFEDIKTAFNKKYVAEDGRIKGDTQCCYLMALKFELLPDELRGKVAQYLVEDVAAKDSHLSTGFVGVSYLLPMLTTSGHLDTAYKLLLQDTFPSWLFSVKHGATTIWERWDGWTPEKGFQDAGMNSFNHYSLGSCGEWLYDSVAGIKWDIAQPGYKHSIIHPQVPADGELTWAKGAIGSPYGEISSAWKVDAGKLTMDVTIPPNTTATVYVPTHKGDSVMESDKPVDQAEGVKFVRAEDDASVLEVQSGHYHFSVGR